MGFNDWRLMAEAGTERQCLVLDPNADPALAPTGLRLRFITVKHDDCSHKSGSEGDRIREGNTKVFWASARLRVSQD